MSGLAGTGRDPAKRRRPAKGRMRAAVGLAILTLGAGCLALAQSRPDVFTDRNGGIRVPGLGYRDRLTVIGTKTFRDAEGQLTETHRVYASPGSIQAFRRTGTFPPGVVLLKEVLGPSQPGQTGQLAGWFVMIRPARAHTSHDRYWAEGWGWAYVDARDGSRPASRGFKTDCEGCHMAVKATAWVHVEEYASFTK